MRKMALGGIGDRRLGDHEEILTGASGRLFDEADLPASPFHGAMICGRKRRHERARRRRASIMLGPFG